MHLKNPQDKGKIFTNTGKLKDARNANNKSYSVSNQTSAKRHAVRMGNKQIQRTNDRTTGENLNIVAEKGILKVDGNEYKKLVNIPPLREILWPTIEQRGE